MRRMLTVIMRKQFVRQLRTTRWAPCISSAVTASADGAPPTVTHVSGTPNQHPVLTSNRQHTGTLTVTLSAGLQAYDLTFG